MSRDLFSPTWNDISSSLGVSITTFEEVGLARGTLDEQIWEVLPGPAALPADG